MKIFRPMLFVGLGGTGCRVGAELERRLREDLCGPDGTRLLRDKRGSNYLAYQLPRCLQFVYADLSADELAGVRREVVPGREHDAAAQRTMRLMTNLIPADLSNSSAVSQRLSLTLDESVLGWLPPEDTDPNVGPLVKGAGQLPTVGRAVLFETLRRDPKAALQAVDDALSDINRSGDDLLLVSDDTSVSVDGVDVFVVFSVAGGTGSGIFYDYLHLIGDALKHKNISLYPLVLMPSAFEQGTGGGRAAELNAGSSLIDLYRLVDDQNAQGAQKTFDSAGAHGAMSVHYPRLGQLHLPASTVQSGFLFGRPIGGLNRDSIGRSMVALMLSIIGAGPAVQGTSGNQPAQAGGKSMSFADTFINGAAHRNSPADNGVGRRGVSTSAVAELTIPLQEITDVLTSRFLTNAINQLGTPKLGIERNGGARGNVLRAAGVHDLVEARPASFPDEEIPSGKYEAIVKALNNRGKAMARRLGDYPQNLPPQVANMAHKFSPGEGADAALSNGIDLFRLERILFGHRELGDDPDRAGIAGWLERFRYPPSPPRREFSPVAPPGLAGLPKKRLLSSLKPNDPAVVEIRRTQDQWYQWRVRQEWNSAWGDNHRTWNRTWSGFRDEFEALLAPFRAHAREEPALFEIRARELYQSRVGVSYLLPPQDRGLLGFYGTVLKRLKDDYAADLGPNAAEGDILGKIVDSAVWAKAYREGRDDPTATFAHIRQRVKEAIADRLRPVERGKPALVPSMVDLLAAAAGKAGSEVRVADEDLRQFEQKLAVLVPGQYAPEGPAPLQVLFTYPAQDTDEDIERYLRSHVPLPKDFIAAPEYRAVRADSMVVVLLRTNMGVTEVPEVRKVMKLWSDAQRHEQPTDRLAWRRRLQPDAGYLIMTPQDREHVLFRLLCEAWNGGMKVAGDRRSPDSVSLHLGSRGDAGTMVLDLTPVGALSSWGSLLQAYERWVLVDDNAVRLVMAQRLMGSRPDRVDTSSVQPAAHEFADIVDSARDELAAIKRAREDRLLHDDPQLSVFEEFWNTILRGALDREIGSTRKTLGTLREQIDRAQQLRSP